MKITMLVFALSMSVGCAARVATAPDSETIGSLSQGPSVYTAPLKHDAPPEMGQIVDTGDDNRSDKIVTETAETIEIAPKSDGIKLGNAR